MECKTSPGVHVCFRPLSSCPFSFSLGLSNFFKIISHHRAGIQATYTGQPAEKGGLEATASLGYGQAGCRFSDLDRHSSKPLIVQQAASEKTQEIVVA